jgi:hypothetical protein
VEHPFTDLPRIRATKRVGGRYLLKADISRFYHSIYTHTIPWALHTKALAKQKRHRNSMALLGNRLDYFIRRAQDDQTMGVPIGPDTSLVIAETILRRLDEDLERRLGRLRGFRAVDDYELAFDTAADAERALAELQGTLLDFELDINDLKTVILELPQGLEDPWTVSLATFRVSRRNPISQKYDLTNYATLAFATAKQYPGASALRYALGKLARIRILQPNWDLYQHLLMQCALGEADTLSYVLSELVRYEAVGLPVERSLLESVLNSVVLREAPIGQGNEVAWALWGLLVFDLELSAEAASALGRLEDSVAAILALDLRSRGSTAATLDVSRWQAHVSPEGLYGPQWLLAYEAPGHGWLSGRAGADPATSDPAFALLRQEGVYFYRPPGSALEVVESLPRGPLTEPEEEVDLTLYLGESGTYFG